VNSGDILKKRKRILTQENGKLNTKKLDKVDGERKGIMDHIKGEKRESGMQE
jgi:ribosomal protein RSM22 (predicted rRNA methylase)